MTYSIKELFYTLQGEGARAGRAAVFCRFSGCNLWNGLESAREGAACTFCDTSFVGVDGIGGGRFADSTSLSEAIASAWTPRVPRNARRYVVFTGGEPLLQLDTSLVDSLHAASFEIAIETNGTIAPPPGVDWICVSPKSTTELRITSGDELKLIYPQADARPERFESLDFEHFYLQPMDGPHRARNTDAAVRYCLDHPQWKLSVQTQKECGFR